MSRDRQCDTPTKNMNSVKSGIISHLRFVTFVFRWLNYFIKIISVSICVICIPLDLVLDIFIFIGPDVWRSI